MTKESTLMAGSGGSYVSRLSRHRWVATAHFTWRCLLAYTGRLLAAAVAVAEIYRAVVLFNHMLRLVTSDEILGACPR